MKVVQGDDYEWEMKVFYFNHKIKQIFWMLPTAVEKKLTCLFISCLHCLMTQIQLLRETLLKVKSSGCANTVNTLNKVIAAFHEPENKIITSSIKSQGKVGCV